MLVQITLNTYGQISNFKHKQSLRHLHWNACLICYCQCWVATKL